MRHAHLKPRRLRPGDRVAIVSPSWGGPSLYPGVYERGLDTIRDLLGLEPVEMPTARMPAGTLASQPKRRAADLNEAFADDSIAAVFTTIGGDDSVRLLPHLDIEAMQRHPKLVMGYSDITTLLATLAGRGLVTMHGPTVMAGLAQADALGDAYRTHLRALLLENPRHYDYRPYPMVSTGYPDWSDPATIGQVNPQTENAGWHWLQRAKDRRGRFWGGCIEVLEFLKGSDYWPSRSYFDDVFLLLETSEEAPPPALVQRILRNYGLQSILDRIQGLVIGRPANYTAPLQQELIEVVRRVVVEEYGRTDIPIVMHVDVGHTDPQWLVPFGVEAMISSAEQRIALVDEVFD